MGLYEQSVDIISMVHVDHRIINSLCTYAHVQLNAIIADNYDLLFKYNNANVREVVVVLLCVFKIVSDITNMC